MTISVLMNALFRSTFALFRPEGALPGLKTGRLNKIFNTSILFQLQSYKMVERLSEYTYTQAVYYTILSFNLRLGYKTQKLGVIVIVYWQ